MKVNSKTEIQHLKESKSRGTLIIDRQVVLRHFHLQVHVIRRAARKTFWKGAVIWERHFQHDGSPAKINTREAEF